MVIVLIKYLKTAPNAAHNSIHKVRHLQVLSGYAYHYIRFLSFFCVVSERIVSHWFFPLVLGGHVIPLITVHH